MNIKDGLSEIEYRAEAERWLNKAVEMEAQNKPLSLVNKAFDLAVENENAARKIIQSFPPSIRQVSLT